MKICFTKVSLLKVVSPTPNLLPAAVATKKNKKKYKSVHKHSQFHEGRDGVLVNAGVLWKFRNLLGVFSGCLLVLLGWCSIQTYSINIKSLGMLWWFLMNDHIIHQCDGLCYETTNCQFRWAQHVLTHVPSNLCWSLALPQRLLTIVTKPSTNFQSYLSLSRPHRIQKGQKTILDENQPLVNQLIN